MGLFYAGLLPAALAGHVALLVLVIWAGVKAMEIDEAPRGLILFAMIVVGGIVIAQLPAAYYSAKQYCREEWTDSGATSLTWEAPFSYRLTKCMSIWPHGPDR